MEEKIRRKSALTTKQQQRQQDQQQQQESLAPAVLNDVLRSRVEDPSVDAQHSRDEQINLTESQQEEVLEGLVRTSDDS